MVVALCCLVVAEDVAGGVKRLLVFGVGKEVTSLPGDDWWAGVLPGAGTILAPAAGVMLMEVIVAVSTWAFRV